jgi:hypothetical protein
MALSRYHTRQSIDGCVLINCAVVLDCLLDLFGVPLLVLDYLSDDAGHLAASLLIKRTNGFKKFLVLSRGLLLVFEHRPEESTMVVHPAHTDGTFPSRTPLHVT